VYESMLLKDAVELLQWLEEATLDSENEGDDETTPEMLELTVTEDDDEMEGLALRL